MKPNNCEADFPTSETIRKANPICVCNKVEQAEHLYYISILTPPTLFYVFFYPYESTQRSYSHALNDKRMDFVAASLNQIWRLKS